jgi:hypothetical protein
MKMLKVTLYAIYAKSTIRWRKDFDVMLEKIPGVVHRSNLRIIQLLEADLNQVVRAYFARNIITLAHYHEVMISEHQYG